MNTTIHTEEQDLRAKFEAELQAAAAKRQRIRDAEAAVSDAQRRVDLGPERLLYIDAILANVIAQKAQIFESVSHKLTHRGEFDRDQVLQRLTSVATAERYRDDLMRVAKESVIFKARDALKLAKESLKALETTAPGERPGATTKKETNAN